MRSPCWKKIGIFCFDGNSMKPIGTVGEWLSLSILFNVTEHPPRKARRTEKSLDPKSGQ